MKRTALSALARRTAQPPISWLMQMALTRPKLISLAAGFTDNPSLPVRATRRLLNQLLASPRTGQPALQYGATAGDPELRQLTAAHLARQDGAQPDATAYSPDRLILTHGSQQLLYMVTEALCDEGDIVLVEDPTYFVYLGIAQSRRLRCRGVRLETDGVDLKHLEQVLESLKKRGELRRVKMLYLVSYFQNPTGATTSFAKKSAALALLRKYERAAGHPIYLLEDAAYRELRFVGEDIASALAARGAAGRVIYTGTFSKPFATGVRVGYGVLPEPVLTAVTRIKGNHDFGTANLLQRLLARALASGEYDRHLITLRRRYGRKARVMAEAVREHFPSHVEWAMPKGGLYIWARLPKNARSGVDSKLFKTGLANDVIYVPGALCYCDDGTRRKPDRELRLSFGAASEASLRTGIARLGQALAKTL
ncbi:MAG: PLP-dependent aminotransferase family protein [Pedosphaera sp.]|nr:PLP-dependent aminotransferase family protein [Pedosphaera sp.]MST00355.1 PLP-dependent aminotransferase family protein [Pedosphaera sp.]